MQLATGEKKLKMHMRVVYMKEEKLHHGQCQRLLIVRGYTSSSNCMMEETATEYTQAMHTRDGQGSNYYMYG